MTQISIGDAFGAGLRVIQRKPFAPLVWGLVYFVCAYLPAMLTMALVLPGFSQSLTPGATPDPSRMMAMMAPMQMMNLVQFGFSIIGLALINAAICRAVLEPENDRAFYLRLGAQELWQGLVLLVLYILLGVAMVVLMIPMIIIMVVMGVSAMGHGSNALAMIPVVLLFTLIALGVLLYLWLRLSMALPMSFVHRQFRLFESWSFTKGNVLRLFGLGVLLTLVVLIAEMVVFTLLAVLGFGAFAAAGGLSKIQSFASQPPSAWLPTLAIWAIPVTVIFSAVVGYLMTFGLAPWADCYRQLAGPSYADVFSDTAVPVLP